MNKNKERKAVSTAFLDGIDFGMWMVKNQEDLGNSEQEIVPPFIIFFFIVIAFGGCYLYFLFVVAFLSPQVKAQNELVSYCTPFMQLPVASVPIRCVTYLQSHPYIPTP